MSKNSFPACVTAGELSLGVGVALLSVLLVGCPSSSVDVGGGVDIDRDDDGLIEISTAAELNNVRYVLDGSGYRSSATAAINRAGCPSGGCIGYELIADITLATPQSPATGNWEPIGSAVAPFSAIFDGNDNTITGLTMQVDRADQSVALFGVVGTAAEIRNAHVADVGITSIVGSSRGFNYIAGLAGQNFGRISGCSADVTIIGSSDVIITDRPAAYFEGIGGLVGKNAGGIIENSWSDGTVQGHDSASKDDVGGLVGANVSSADGLKKGRVQNSWSTADGP